jgi:hypothetical protein
MKGLSGNQTFYTIPYSQGAIPIRRAAEDIKKHAVSLSVNDSVSRRPIIRLEQGSYCPAKDSVALARKVFKSIGIEKGDPAAGITNQSLHL